MDYARTLTKQPRDLSSRQALGLIGLAALVSIVLLALPWLGYPFRLLITMVHELGHGLAAILTGGDFVRFVVYPNGAGLAYTSGGWRLVVIPAGYLGVALFGAGLIWLGRSARWSRIALGVIGTVMMLFSLRYGAPTLFAGEFLAGLLTIFSGVIFGGLFWLAALKAPVGGVVFVLHLIAFQAAITALSDLVGLIGLSARFFNAPENDAMSMAQLTYIPAIVWALLWAVVAFALVGGAVWVTWLKPALTSLNGK
jgi:hypothetical protein